MTGHAVLNLVADDAQIVHMRVLDCERERREGKRPDIDFARRERGNNGRRAFVAGGFGNVGLAEVLEDVLFRQHERRERGRHDHPADANLYRPLAPRRALPVAKAAAAAVPPRLNARRLICRPPNPCFHGDFSPCFARWPSVGPINCGQVVLSTAANPKAGQ